MPIASEDDGKSAVRFTEYALDPEKGTLKKRLDMSFAHMPVPADGSNCQLHRWAARIGLSSEQAKKSPLPEGARKHVMKCETCNVKLCVRSWKTFHTVGDLKKKKDEILGKK